MAETKHDGYRSIRRYLERRLARPEVVAKRESSYMRDMPRKRAFRIGRSRTGLGLFAIAPIKKGAFIVEYKGRKLTNEQANKLEARGSRYLYEILESGFFHHGNRVHADEAFVLHHKHDGFLIKPLRPSIAPLH
jgi:hypothetical protein